MQSYLKALASAALLAAVFTPMAHAAPPPPAQTQWSDITEVVVRARARGPAMWKLTRGDAVVWVLGVMDVKPNELDWNSNHFRRVLQGAKVLILPRESDWDPTNSDLPKHVQLPDVITAALWKRFETRTMNEGFSDTTYIHYKPVWAGARLMSDVIDEHDISDHIIPDKITELAQAEGVTVQPLQRDDAQTMLRLYDTLDAQSSEACLSDYLDSIDYLLTAMPRVTQAWARGDLKTVMRDHRELGYTTCIMSDPASAALYSSYAIDNMKAAVDDALKTPGKSVAVWPLSDLLRKDGVLDQLRAEGVVITSPAS